MFTAMAYNILAPSLGSNSIPWVLRTTPDVKELAAKAASAIAGSATSWEDVVATCAAEYKRAWHKNLATRPFALTRVLWGAHDLTAATHLPDGLSIVDATTASYVTPDGPQRASSLRGTLINILGGEAGESVFGSIMDVDNSVFSWDVRASRIVGRITSPYADLPAADVVSLSEYEGHEMVAPYRTGQPVETLADAMNSLGYSGVFFHGPDPDRSPPAGLATYWNRDVFELEAPAALWGGSCLQVPCGQVTPGLAAYSVDLLEADLPPSRRKNFSLVRLVHKPTGQPVWVVGIHMMTQSLDRSGELRAKEMAVCRDSIARLVPPGDRVVVLGDFNTDASNTALLSGTVGCEVVADTGFDKDKRTLSWGSEPLVEAFADVHNWTAPSSTGFCTSNNGVRCEWIDYVFFPEKGLRVVARSDTALAVPPEGLPTTTEGSDHFAVAVQFELI